MTKSTRIGRKMSLVAALCSHSPRAVIDVAARVGPHGSLCYGYAIVKRAIRAGIVAYAPPLPGRRGMSIVVTGVV